MKIFIVLNHLNKTGGVERMVTNLANELSEFEDYAIEIISIFGKANENIIKLNTKVKTTFFMPSVDYKNSLCRRYYVLKRFISMSRKHSNSVYISTSSSLSLIILISKLFRKKIKILSWEHSLLFEQSFFNKIIHRFFYRFINKIIVLNDLDEKYAKKYNPNVEIIDNFINDKDAQLSTLVNKRIISVGRLEKEKGFEFLIQALSPVFEKYPEWIFEIYGDGSLKSQLQGEINKSNLEDHIFLKGNYENISEAYCKASIFILGSKSESFGMVILEAAMHNLPVVVPRLHSKIVELSKFAIHNYIYEPLDTQNFVEKLSLCINELSAFKNTKVNLRQIANLKKTALSSWTEILRE